MGSRLTLALVWSAAAMGLVLAALVVREFLPRQRELELRPTALLLLLPAPGEEVEIRIGGQKATLPVVIDRGLRIHYNEGLPVQVGEVEASFATEGNCALAGSYAMSAHGYEKSGRDFLYLDLECLCVGSPGASLPPTTGSGKSIWLPALRRAKTWFRVEGNQAKVVDPGPVLTWLAQADLRQPTTVLVSP